MRVRKGTVTIEYEGKQVTLTCSVDMETYVVKPTIPTAIAADIISGFLAKHKHANETEENF